MRTIFAVLNITWALVKIIFRRYLRYCISSVHHGEDRSHNHFFIRSSHVRFLTIHSNNWRHLPLRVKIYGSSLLNATASLFEEILFVRDRLRFIIERNWKRNTYSSLVRMKFFITPSRGFEMYRFRYITSTCVSIVMVTCRFVLKNVPGIHCSLIADVSLRSSLRTACCLSHGSRLWNLPPSLHNKFTCYRRYGYA